MIPAGKFNCLNVGIIRPKRILNPLNLVRSCPCEFWFDGQDEDTIHLFAATNRVLRWEDKSIFGRDVANAVDAQRPTWDLATGRITFNNVAQTYLQSAIFGVLAEPNTIYVLAKMTGNIADKECFFTGNPGGGNAFIMNASKWNIYSGVYLADGVSNNNDNIHCGEFNGATSNYWINGILVANGNAGVGIIQQLLIGAFITDTFNIDVEICEIFGFNCSLAISEHSKCFDYINNKWSLGLTNPW